MINHAPLGNGSFCLIAGQFWKFVCWYRASVFEYIGEIVTSNGRCDTNVKKRIIKCKSNFMESRNTTRTRRHFHSSNFVCGLCSLYGCKRWTVSNEMKRKCHWSSMFRLSWAEKKANSEVLMLYTLLDQFFKSTHIREMRFLGYIKGGKID